MSGTLFTFYSYKGGVGRTMALANIAMHLFRRPLNVIVVDWDLEAPGLERYFLERFPDIAGEPKPEHHEGLCDLVATYKATISRPPPSGVSNPSPFPRMEEYLVTLDERDECALRLLGAGNRSDWPKYATFVQTFNWSDFYENWSGGALVDWLHDELCERADVVLVDSRTGITEIGGVTTHQLADVIVMAFAPNEENMASSARMATGFMSAQTASERNRPLPVIFVPSRIDAQDSTEYSRFRSRLFDTFNPLVADGLREGASLEEMSIPYAAAISFRERLIYGDSELERRFPLITSAYSAIAANMQRLAPEGSWLRKGSRPVARSRVLLIGGGAHREGIARVLVEHGVEVMGDDGDSFGSSPSGPRDPAGEMASVQCVVVLIDEYTMASRVFSRTVALAERLEKPILPLVVSPDVTTPPEILHLYPLQWDGTAAAERLLLDAIAGRPRDDPNDSPRGSGNVFISHAGQDHALARAIAKELNASGVDVWYDETILLPGSEWRRELADAIATSSAVVTVVSPAAIESRWWSLELESALAHDKLIIPVVVGDLALDSLPPELRRRQVIRLGSTQTPVTELRRTGAFTAMVEALRDLDRIDDGHSV